MKTPKPASALMVVLTGTAGLVILLFACWQVGSWHDDLVRDRELFSKRFYATELVLNSGLAMVKQQFDALQLEVERRPDPIMLPAPRVMVSGQNVEVRLTVGNPPDGLSGTHLVVRAVLVDQGQAVCCLTCFVEKKQSSSTKEFSFVAHHFTSHASS